MSSELVRACTSGSVLCPDLVMGKRVSENCGRGQGDTHHNNPDLDGAWNTFSSAPCFPPHLHGSTVQDVLSVHAAPGMVVTQVKAHLPHGGRKCVGVLGRVHQRHVNARGDNVVLQHGNKTGVLHQQVSHQTKPGDGVMVVHLKADRQETLEECGNAFQGYL